jgi:tetratricopeptide (TPR) repeat protein
MKTEKFFGRFLAVCLFVLVAQLNYAQPANLSPQMAAANELYKAQKWTEAANAYGKIVKNEPQNGGAWYQLAMAQFSLKRYEQAIAPFEKAVEISKSPVAMYNLACAYARLNRKEKAFEWLEKSLATNMAMRFANFAADPDLESLRDDARFKKLADATERKTKPCMFSAEARQFDFWLGEWDVFNPQGQKVGTSRIENVSVGCAVLENWSASAASGGKSLNFYDPQAKKWFQYWMGANGLPQRYAGVYKDGAMRYESEGATPDGKKLLSRLTFFNLDANTVRQLAETSIDEGKTWQILYDFKYVRTK